MEVTNKLLRESEVRNDLSFCTGKYDPPDRLTLPVGSSIRERKVLPRRNKAEQHPGDLAEVARTWNVY